jgi:hypothetical protein
MQPQHAVGSWSRGAALACLQASSCYSALQVICTSGQTLRNNADGCNLIGVSSSVTATASCRLGSGMQLQGVAWA